MPAGHSFASRNLPDPPVDLRRRAGREFAELLVARADALAAPDRALIRAVFREGLSVREVAELQAGAASSTPDDAQPGASAGTDPGARVRTLRRRVRALIARMTSTRFLIVLRAAGPGATPAAASPWPATRRRVAVACVLQGMTLRDAARSLRLSLHSVRRHMDVINALADATHAATPPPLPPVVRVEPQPAPGVAHRAALREAGSTPAPSRVLAPAGARA